MLGSDKRPPHSSPILPQFFHMPRSFPTFPENLSVGSGTSACRDPSGGGSECTPKLAREPRCRQGDNKRDAQARREAPVTFVEGDEGGERGEEVGNGEKGPIRESTGCRALSRGAGHRGAAWRRRSAFAQRRGCVSSTGGKKESSVRGVSRTDTLMCAPTMGVSQDSGERMRQAESATSRSTSDSFTLQAAKRTYDGLSFSKVSKNKTPFFFSLPSPSPSSLELAERS